MTADGEKPLFVGGARFYTGSLCVSSTLPSRCLWLISRVQRVQRVENCHGDMIMAESVARQRIGMPIPLDKHLCGRWWQRRLQAYPRL